MDRQLGKECGAASRSALEAAGHRLRFWGLPPAGGAQPARSSIAPSRHLAWPVGADPSRLHRQSRPNLYTEKNSDCLLQRKDSLIFHFR